MKTSNLLRSSAVLLGVLVISEPTRAELNYPTVGKTTTHECTGPYGDFTSTVVWIKDGIIRDEGHISGRGDTFEEKERLGIGTTLFRERDRGEWLDHPGHINDGVLYVRDLDCFIHCDRLGCFPAPPIM